jgi:hypothetical protein
MKVMLNWYCYVMYLQLSFIDFYPVLCCILSTIKWTIFIWKKRSILFILWYVKWLVHYPCHLGLFDISRGNPALGWRVEQCLSNHGISAVKQQSRYLPRTQNWQFMHQKILRIYCDILDLKILNIKPLITWKTLKESSIPEK